MVKRYITQGNLLMEVNRADGGCWVNLVAPTLEECVQIAQEFQIDLRMSAPRWMMRKAPVWTSATNIP